MNVPIAIAAAVGAAVTFAGSAVEQQRAAATAPADESLSPRLIADLLHRRTWLLGIGGMVLAYVLQAVALGFGNVALVEPLVATELLFAVPLAIRVRKRRAGKQEWGGVVLVAGGVTIFLVASSPSGGSAHPPVSDWLVALLPAVFAIVVLLFVARGPQTTRRAMLLGAAAGVANAMVALITKSFTTEITQSVAGAFESWQLYTLFVFGAAGFLFAQSAYQAAPLAESLPVMDSIEPTASVVLAAGVLGEHLDLAPVHGVFELTGAVAAIAGVILLGRSPVVLSIYEQQQKHRERHDDSSRESGGGARGPSVDTARGTTSATREVSPPPPSGGKQQTRRAG